jgi:hypothetical protein
MQIAPKTCVPSAGDDNFMKALINEYSFKTGTAGIRDLKFRAADEK